MVFVVRCKCREWWKAVYRFGRYEEGGEYSAEFELNEVGVELGLVGMKSVER